MIIGITGGIGAGKSTVLAMFRDLGCATADADDIAHSMYGGAAAPAYRAIVEHFGTACLDDAGNVNRKYLAARVFGDSAELAWLNGVIHPLVQAEIMELAAKVAPAPLYCAVPLLYETGWDAFADKVISIWCSGKNQRARLAMRGWDEGEISRRIASQMSMDEKLRRADYGIINDSSLENCRGQVEMIVDDMSNGKRQ